MAGKSETKNLGDHGIYLLTGEIDESECEEAIRFVLEANLSDFAPKVHH